MKLGLVLNLLKRKRKMEKNNLTKKEKKELAKVLKKLQDEILNEAKNLVNDYTKNPSDMSGSLVTIHQNSPILKKN